MATFSRQATLHWDGDFPAGSARIVVGSDAFAVAAIVPTIVGDPPGAAGVRQCLHSRRKDGHLVRSQLLGADVLLVSVRIDDRVNENRIMMRYASHTGGLRWIGTQRCAR
jgi:hypothetical protein